MCPIANCYACSLVLARTITLDGAVLKQVCSSKYSSVYLYQHHTWPVHVDYVLSRVRRKSFCYKLGQISCFSSFAVVVSGLYCTLL